MLRFLICTGVLALPAMLIVGGCGGSETKRTEAATETSAAGTVLVNDMSSINGDLPVPHAASPGASPTYGTQTGTGFSTGDALHASGQGSGMMGFHGTGALGTSGAISDGHDAGEPDKNAKDPVLPAQ